MNANLVKIEAENKLMRRVAEIIEALDIAEDTKDLIIHAIAREENE